MPHYSSCNELRSYKNDTHQLKLVRVGKCYANKNKKACYWWQENGTILLRLNVIASTIVSGFHEILEHFAEKTTKTQANPAQSVQSIEEGKDQVSIQSSTTPGPGTLWESDKNKRNITYKRVEKSALSQKVITRLHETDKTAHEI